MVSKCSIQLFFQKMFTRKAILLLCLILCASGQHFTGMNLDRNLVEATNDAMSNLRGVLSIFSCRGNQLFEAPSVGRFNSQRYVLYSVVMSVANNLQSIVNALKANNVVVGNNNLVEGRGNILIGNNDIVRGNSLWVFASEQKVGGDQLLIMGNFRIDMNNVYGILNNPSSVISCLNPNQSRDYFALFGVNGGAVPSHLASQINGVRLLI